MRTPLPLEVLLRRGSTVEPNGCIRWKYIRRKDGYGAFYLKRQGKKLHYLAHRIAYQVFVGPIPDGLQLDHLCRNRWCINPAHLEPVTNRENCLRSSNPAIAIHLSGCCAKGHPISGDNLYVSPGDGRKRCLTCTREWGRLRYWRNKAAGRV